MPQKNEHQTDLDKSKNNKLMKVNCTVLLFFTLILAWILWKTIKVYYYSSGKAVSIMLLFLIVVSIVLNCFLIRWNLIGKPEKLNR